MSSRRTCRHRHWSGSRATPGSSRSTCVDRCPPSRPRRPAGAPASTPGSRAGTAVPLWWTSMRCRVPTTTRRPSTWTSRRCGTRSCRPSGRTGPPSRSRWTSRSRSTATCCAPASTRSSPTLRGAAASSLPWWSSTGRRVHRRRTRRHAPPVSCSSPCTGSRGRAGRAPRSTRCAPRSATSAPARPCTRSGCSTRPRSPSCCARLRRPRSRRPSVRSSPGPTGAGRGRTRPPVAARGGRARRPLRRAGRHNRRRPRCSTATEPGCRRRLVARPVSAPCGSVEEPGPHARELVVGHAVQAQVPGDVEVGQERAQVPGHLVLPCREPSSVRPVSSPRPASA